MKKLVKIVLGIGIMALGVFVFVLMGKKETALEPPKKSSLPLVATALAEPKSISYSIEVTGTVNAKHKVEVYSEVQGVLLAGKTPFKEGNTFYGNETLLRLDDREFKAQLLSNKSNLVSQIAAMLPDMEMEFPEASKKWEHYLKTFEMDGSLEVLPETSSDLEKFFLMGKGVFQTYYNVKNQQERALKYTIKAPFTGTVTESNVNPGTLVRSGQKLGEFIDPSVFELQLAIPATANRYIKVGKKVKLSTLDDDQEFMGELSRINDKVDQGTQTVGAIVEVSHKDLKDGQYLSATIKGTEIKDVIRIKGNLILENDYVYIIKDSALALQKVRPVNYYRDSVVVKGLSNHMIVLDEVLANAYPGMKVNY